MATTKSHYELKQAQLKKKNPNTITDADYFLRDKTEEAKRGYPNSIDITPESMRKKPAPKKETAKGEE
jgi:hypothetical protein